MKTEITYQEYLQLEGLYALVRIYAKKHEEIQKVAADILRSKENEDDYDATYLLMDNAWEDGKTFKDIIRGKIKIKKEKKGKK